jgi:predicted polyphosphate/ATP-dependent NAD kinase
MTSRGCEPAVGIVANPSSGRDVRRLLGWASVFPTAEKVNVVLRLLAGLGSQGVRVAWMLPDSAGIGAHVRDAADLAARTRGVPMPQVRLLPMRIRDTAHDSAEATAAMVALGVDVIAVLGGDGTHRAVAACCGEVPLATLSTGTNNAFPERHEATLVGLAAGLVARGAVDEAVGLRRHKRLRVLGDGVDEIALVDVACTHHAGTGARAVARGDAMSDLYVAFAEPSTIGLASLAGLAQPVSRDEPWGLHLRLGADGRTLHAPLLAGAVQTARIAQVRRLVPNVDVALPTAGGTLALDGERQLVTDGRTRLHLRLELDGPRTVAVERVLAHAARRGLLFDPPGPMPLNP